MPTSSSNKPLLLVTMGDPSGIGPEVALKALSSREVLTLADFLLIGDRRVIEKTERRLRLRLKVPLVDLANVPPKKFSYGKSDKIFGKASIEYLDKALEMLDVGRGDALVTGPVNKSSVVKASFKDFKGHTEYLASKTGTKDVAMMFVGERLKVTLVTRHIALNKVSASLNAEKIIRTIRLTHDSLKRLFGIKEPRIGVTGLNPHAGDSGIFGSEEERVIRPAIEKASRSGFGVTGPLVPDAAFYDALNGKFDAIVAMYHDQGLIPFKTLYFRSGVNLTLGLPFIRTSPDHGTAFDIAGKGMANPRSMIEAIKLASRLVRR